VLACWRKAESHRPLFPRTVLLPPPLLLLLLLLLLSKFIHINSGTSSDSDKLCNVGFNDQARALNTTEPQGRRACFSLG
jgi:hypothetical protein